MKLSERRVKFSRMVRLLLAHAEILGFYPALDQVKRNRLFCECGEEVKQGHHKSVHFDGLAVDVLLYNSDMEYLADSIYYEEIHIFWSSLGGSDMIPGDGNHFSLEYKGMR